MLGIAEMARRGARVIVEDAFVSGLDARDRWRASLEGLAVLWVGVFCDPAVAAARERARGDRVVGMAAAQAEAVHVGMTYDVTVDTSETSPARCARVVARRLAG
jgi:chloramphenicol 3-O phosphotransferase